MAVTTITDTQLDLGAVADRKADVRKLDEGAIISVRCTYPGGKFSPAHEITDQVALSSFELYALAQATLTTAQVLALAESRGIACEPF